MQFKHYSGKSGQRVLLFKARFFTTVNINSLNTDTNFPPQPFPRSILLPSVNGMDAPCITIWRSKTVSAKGDFRHFRSSGQHADGCVWLAGYDFLLVFLALGLNGTVDESLSVKSCRTAIPKKKSRNKKEKKVFWCLPSSSQDPRWSARGESH